MTMTAETAQALMCPFSIRWGRGRDTACEREEHLPGDPEHSGTVYGGGAPVTTVTWLAGDRREYPGPWPGNCGGHLGLCPLPAGHNGRCPV
jgi:hypothetical protein